MRFLVDAQLPPRLIDWLAERAHSATHVYDLAGGLRMSDDEIWDFARRDDLVIVTKDSDFLDLAVVRGTPPKVLLIGLGNMSTAALLTALDAALPVLVTQLDRSDVGVVMLRPERVEILQRDEV